MNFVDAVSPSERWAFAQFAAPLDYRVGADNRIVSLPFFVKGLKADDVFANVMQGDQMAVCDVALFVAATGQPTPRRYDRLMLWGLSYSVEDWRGAPQTSPVFFKLQLRGGQV